MSRSPTVQTNGIQGQRGIVIIGILFGKLDIIRIKCASHCSFWLRTYWSMTGEIQYLWLPSPLFGGRGAGGLGVRGRALGLVSAK